MIDIIFVHTGESFCDRNINKLKSRFPLLKVIQSSSLDQDIFKARNISFTKSFWLVYGTIEISNEFNFDYVIPDWDNQYVHSFQYMRNNDIESGMVYLINKKYNKEIQIKHIEEIAGAENIEVEELTVNEGKNDIIFVHTGEIMCDQNFSHLKMRFPSSKKILSTDTLDKILDKASSIATTDSFWIVNGYMEISKEFNFDYIIPEWDNQYVHSFQYIHNNEVKSGKVYQVNKDYDKEIKIKHIEQISGNENGLYDIVFISYDEPNYVENYQKLLKRFPNSKHVHGVKGIHQAHIEAASISHTNMIWVVDADALIVDDFYFNYAVSEWDLDNVHVWRSLNPVNGLSYGYGGVKLIPRILTLNMDITRPDMSTSISNKFKAVDAISNITAFNTDPFNSWKSAFRECVKLSSKIIDRQNTSESDERLQVWMSKGLDKPFGNYCIEGAKDGYQWGNENRNNVTELFRINDFEWLKERFNKRYG